MTKLPPPLQKRLEEFAGGRITLIGIIGESLPDNLIKPLGPPSNLPRRVLEELREAGAGQLIDREFLFSTQCIHQKGEGGPSGNGHIE